MSELWVLEQTDFNSSHTAAHMESLFTLGNGYLGIRGDSILSGTVFQRGTYINGFYESGPITYGEKAYGYAQHWQTIIPLPEGKELNITIDGIELFNKSGCFKRQKRTLNMKEGFLLWEFIWCDENMLEYSGSVRSVVPFHYEGTVLFEWTLSLPADNSSIVIESHLKGEFSGGTVSNDPRLPGHFNGSSLIISCDEGAHGKSLLSLDALGSGLLLKCAMSHTTTGIDEEKVISNNIKNGIKELISGKSRKEISFVKAITYSYDRKENALSTEIRVIEQQDKFKKEGFDKIKEVEKLFMNNFWENSDILIEGDKEVQLSLRYNLFELLQSTGRDGQRSIAAKGLSGSGYEGHYFWDAETYVLPFFIYTNPTIARSMLLYRISILERARERAELLGHKGVLFPWRTINGEESSAYFPAGTAQYHINSDIALGLSKYIEASGDLSILSEGGDSLLAETARFWCDFGSYIEGKGFCFNSVTGPDEYTALVDNNYYTNLSARENLSAAAKWLKGLVNDKEIRQWERTAAAVYLPEEGHITPQDDSFFSKEPWDFASTSEDQYPLLLHFHPLNIYRKQVLKQADVVLAQSLFRSELSDVQKKLNFNFYEQFTTGDSSLSACAQGINAFWLGYDDLAWEYFNETLHTDRKNLHKNVSQGLHTASMGGSYLMVINGFLGLENFENTIRLTPRLPEQISRMILNVSIENKHLQIELDQQNVKYTALDGSIEFYHFSEKIFLEYNSSILCHSGKGNKLVYKGFRPRK